MNILATIYLTFYMVVLLLQQFLILPVGTASLMMLVLGIACIKFYRKTPPNQLVAVFYLLYTTGGIFSWFFNKNADLQEYLWIVSFGGIAVLLLNQKVSFNIISPLYYCSMGLMCFLILVSHGVDALHMLSSRNSISSLGIFLFSIYAISAYQCKRRISLFSVITYAITAFLGIGRSGVFLAVLLLGMWLVWDINKNSFQLRNPIHISTIIIILSICCLLLYDKVLYPAIYNLTWRGMISQSRVNIWINYLSKAFAGMDHFLFGAPVSGNIWLDSYGHNLHNSFLNLHSKYGFGITLLVLIFTIHAFIYFTQQKKLILLIPFLGVLFRAQMDYTNFNGSADCVWYYFIFLPFFEHYKDRLKLSPLKQL